MIDEPVELGRDVVAELLRGAVVGLAGGVVAAVVALVAVWYVLRRR